MPRRVTRSIDNLRRGRTPKDYNGEYQIPSDSCPYLPGTSEKVLLLMYRRAYGLALWHPDDAKLISEQSDNSYEGDRDNFGGLHKVRVVKQWSDGSITEAGSDALPAFLLGFLRQEAVIDPSALKEFPPRILQQLPDTLRRFVEESPDEDALWEDGGETDLPFAARSA